MYTSELFSRRWLDCCLSRALDVKLNNDKLDIIDDSAYVLTLDYTIKMLTIHERYKCGVPDIIEGETGVGKTALVEMLSKLWNQALLLQWKLQQSRLVDLFQEKLRRSDTFAGYQVSLHMHGMVATCNLGIPCVRVG